MTDNRNHNLPLYAGLLQLLYREFPKLKIKKRSEVWWCRLLDKTLLKWSKSQWSCAAHNLIVIPDDFDSWQPDVKYETIRHESEHLRQYRRLGRGNDLWGYLLFCFLYVLVLPTMLTMRAHYEKGAYFQSAVAIHVTHTFVDYDWARQWFIAWMVNTFCRWEYVWMLPFKKHIRKWASRAWTLAKWESYKYIDKDNWVY